jgi:hypothetical protein
MMKKKNREIKEFVLHGWFLQSSDLQIYSTKRLPPSSVSFSFSLLKTLFLIFFSPFFFSSHSNTFLLSFSFVLQQRGKLQIEWVGQVGQRGRKKREGGKKQKKKKESCVE